MIGYEKRGPKSRTDPREFVNFTGPWPDPVECRLTPLDVLKRNTPGYLRAVPEQEEDGNSLPRVPGAPLKGRRKHRNRK